ncbi:MAG: hypothetical protein IH855_12205 [Bacteroidetes bacterium]|nr:hypothetical protein [Bacteroidota bacterium]
MTKETFQRYALVTIVVLLAAIGSQQLTAYARNTIHQDHDMIFRHVDVELFADEQRLLADEARLLGEEARQMAEHFHIRDGVCDLSEEARSFSNEVRHLQDQIRVEIR